ncbi:uncharacterized protein KY384_007041 [Bacidia gigantensis]|uniref:uncharacterized protein n=1 Tax=Bacidia gigantensis TaxID=2732470 RepID=UPI001D047DFC|nr:uncharacterized protein KY384_007041 [Bacidia gigantensis]KAG8528125.1 hypothetical protein KY384_007041 [Bacidia gigantensis]
MVQGAMTSSHRAWNDWQSHVVEPHKDTCFAILTSLRQSYPGHVVTVAPDKTGLTKFAEAGHAKAVLDEEDERFYFWRTYVPADRRSSVDSGKLSDEVKFGKSAYHWDGHDFIVYYADFIVDYVFERRQQYYFILYDRSKTSGEIRPKAVDDLIATSTKWNEDLHDEIWMYDRESWTKEKKLFRSVQQAKWDDVVLDPSMKKDLIDDVEGFFNNEAEYREFSVPFKRGVILHGPPGNGKSLCIKALMNSLLTRPEPIPTLYVKSFQGCHEEWYNIREVFEKARNTTPCLLIFEDLDSMVTEKVRSFFLNEVDGLEDNDGLMIIGSTNYLEKLDPSITKRPSRFDRKFHFSLPGRSERVLYAEYWRGKLAKNQNIEFPEGLAEAIASITDGFSFAYMKEVFITSLLSIVGARRMGAEEPEGLDEVNGDVDGKVNGHVEGASNDYQDVLLWRTVRKQVNILRREMKEADEGTDGNKAKDADGNSKNEEEESVKALVKNFASLLAKYSVGE